jgi:lipoyl(octanoyl) transferase
VGHALQIEWLGEVRYADALALQHAAVEERRTGRAPDRLLLLEHPPVVTLGRSTKPENVKTPLAELLARGIDVHEVARGGDVTYHGRGQLVGYLIADLAARGEPDVTAWLRRIEAGLIDALGELSVPSRRIAGMTGVFVATPDAEEKRKIASIGVGLRGWIAYHGFALNATLDLAEFGDIVPCGLHGVAMTSVAKERAAAPSAALFEEVRECVAEAFGRRFA